jgi:hypothetical protein
MNGRMASVVLVIAAIVGCAEAVEPTAEPNVEPQGDGTPASSARTVTLQSCSAWGGTSTPPCITYRSGINERNADSGRVVLRRDFTASWMLGTTDGTLGPCGTSACKTFTKRVEIYDGTYSIVADTIRVHVVVAGAAQIISLYGKFPAGIDSHWTGPDSLAFAAPGNWGTRLIFRP